MASAFDPCAVNSIRPDPDCNARVGRVRWDAVHSFWNGTMMMATLVLGASGLRTQIVECDGCTFWLEGTPRVNATLSKFFRQSAWVCLWSA